MHRTFIRSFSILLLSALIGCPAPAIAAAPTSRPATAPRQLSATRPSSPLAEQSRRRVQFLLRQALDDARAGRLDEAESALEEAMRIAPNQYLILYNVACLKALRGKTAEAVDYLNRSAEAGFTDFAHLEKDPDLASIRSASGYKALIARKDQYLQREAQRVVDWLRRELGEGYLFEIDTANKLVFATNTDRPTLEALRSRLVMQARSQWEQLFSNRPQRYISVVVPSEKDYRQIVTRKGVGGFYNHDNRILIAQRLGQVMQHEFTHALHMADLDELGQDHPTWLGEGIATLFEPAIFEGEKLVPADNFRLGDVQRAARRNRLIPLKRLLEMDQKAFTVNGVVNLTYGQSGSLLLYLYEQDLLRPFYEKFKARYAEDRTGRIALEETTGKSLTELEKDWKEWMLRRTPPALSTGPQGPVLGIRFGDANDGLRVVYVLPDGPAQVAGVKAGDIVVGVDGTEARDSNTLIPLLASRQAGDTVILSLRRDGEYLRIPITLARRDRISPP